MPALLQNPQPFVQIDPSPVHLHQTLHRNAVALRMLGISERHPQLRPHLLLDHPRQRRVEAAIRLPFSMHSPIASFPYPVLASIESTSDSRRATDTVDSCSSSAPRPRQPCIRWAGP